jgi:CAAX prenyl protease-like protein
VTRVIGTALVVPIVEELAFRGFLQRRLIDANFETVAQDRFTWPSLLVSAVAFGALHENVLAGAFAGIAYSYAGYRRGRLGDSIVAHGTTNLLLAVTAVLFGRWDLLG